MNRNNHPEIEVLVASQSSADTQALKDFESWLTQESGRSKNDDSNDQEDRLIQDALPHPNRMKVLTNFTTNEFLTLFAVLEPVMKRQWTTGGEAGDHPYHNETPCL
eukprot:c13313_g1_i1.p1 GENE.c13313_g1_i1~~c13313_g1_i1.p1  ORF type:complete len:106 (-),score=17.43 c13313_g1_i1:765-1082(-)